MSTDGTDTNSVNNDYDDLEAALVIAAADADARSHVRVDSVEEEQQEEVSASNGVTKEEDQQEQETVHYNQNDEEKAEKEEEKEEDSRKGTKRKLDQEEAEEDSPAAKRSGYATVVAEHYNTLEEKGLDERSKSRIVHMRNFHNWIKSMLINEYLSKIKDNKKHNEAVRVMDMCCGKGGDLLKWKKGGITHLICTDIAAVSLDQCKSRYEDMKLRSYRERYSNIYTIEYIAADSTRVSIRQKYKDVTMKLDLVSCQFAFHYSFESLQQAECMIRNAAECIQPGGYFVGTIPDANELMARARKSGTNSFGNEVYQVTFDTDVTKPPLFGTKYNFHLDGVVDCPEFLVHFPTFVKLAKKYGLKLVRKEKFHEFYERMKVEGRTLMGNMRALETYPPAPGVSPAGSARDDYVHADEFIKNEDCNGAKIGTLSKSEWEASSLYMAFAFQKVKNTWNADGTPCYDI